MSSDQQQSDQAHGEVNASRGPVEGGGSTSNQPGGANTNTDGAVDDRSGQDGSTTAEGGASTSASASDSTNTNTDGADSSDTQNTMSSSLRSATDSEREDLFGNFK